MSNNIFVPSTHLNVAISPTKIRIFLVSFEDTRESEPRDGIDQLAGSIKMGEIVVPIADQEMLVMDDRFEAARGLLKALLVRLDAALEDKAASA